MACPCRRLLSLPKAPVPAEGSGNVRGRGGLGLFRGQSPVGYFRMARENPLLDLLLRHGFRYRESPQIARQAPTSVRLPGGCKQVSGAHRNINRFSNSNGEASSWVPPAQKTAGFPSL